MVSAWASANRLILGQVKVDVKLNEITAIPQLLQVLSLFHHSRQRKDVGECEGAIRKTG